MSEWGNFLVARKSKLASIGPLQRLPLEKQARILAKGIKAGYGPDVMEYLLTINGRPHYADLPVAELMIRSLRDSAPLPGENTATTRAYLQALSERKPGSQQHIGKSMDSVHASGMREVLENDVEMEPLTLLHEARKTYERTPTEFGRLSPQSQADALNDALRKSQKLDVFAYLLEAENPAETGIPRPVSGLMRKWLVDVAASPGENSPKALDLVEALAREGQCLPDILALLDLKVQECLEDPKDDEGWLYTALLLREIDNARFEDFLRKCREHESPIIKKVAAFFDET